MPAWKEVLPDLKHEVTEDYVKNFILKSLATGVIIVGENPDDPEELVASIHGYKAGIRVFEHVLGEVTIGGASSIPGKKNRTNYTDDFSGGDRPQREDIGKVELIARESNRKGNSIVSVAGI